MIGPPPIFPLFPYPPLFRSDLPHAERDEAVRDAGGALEPHRVTRLQRALELWGADGLDSPHGGATPRRRQPSHHARDERSEEHTSELQSRSDLVCRLLLEKK